MRLSFYLIRSGFAHPIETGESLAAQGFVGNYFRKKGGNMADSNGIKWKTAEINRDRLVAEFKRLVSFDSESFHEKEMSEYLKDKLRNLGLRVE